jgi:hypothetical protein
MLTELALSTKKSVPLLARQIRCELAQLRARYDAGAVMPGIYKIIRELEIELAWLERRP